MLKVIHQDDHLLALDKPSGVALFSDRVGDPSLWDPLKVELEAQGRKPLSVHRLDKGTSGVLVVALDRATAELER